MDDKTVEKFVLSFNTLVRRRIKSKDLWILMRKTISDFYDKKPSLKQITAFQSGIHPNLLHLSSEVTKQWKSDYQRHICSFLINFSYRAYNISVSKYLSKEFLEQIVADLHESTNESTNTVDDRLSKLLLLANVAFNLHLNNDTLTKELLSTGNSNLLNLLCTHMKRNSNVNNSVVGDCELALCAPIITFIDNKDYTNTLWLFDSYPNLIESILHEWDCALKKSMVVYNQWTYIPGCWMRAVFANYLMSVSAKYFNIFVENNILQFVARSLKFNYDDNQSSLLLRSHSCHILLKISVYDKYHGLFLQLQFAEDYELWKTMNEMAGEMNSKEHDLNAEITDIVREYDMAVHNCRQSIVHIREYYIQPLLEVKILGLEQSAMYGGNEYLHFSIVHEIVNFIWY